jgi:trans-2,3-dihydro-3-hydroxyanthranilate isomerase
MARLPYRIVDVFTDRPFSGNPLAVVLGADDLETAQLQALAREFNLSETAFPMAADQPGADYRVRIFMPGRELPFAGHPSVGTAWVLANEGTIAATPPSTTVRMSCGAGVLPLVLRCNKKGEVDEIELTAGQPVTGPPLPRAAAVAALSGLGLTEGDLGRDWAMRVCSTGLPQAFIAVADEAALGRIAVRANEMNAASAADGWQTISVLSMDTDSGAGDAAVIARARVFAEGLGWGEDPATGSAGSALGAWLAAEGLAADDGETRYQIIQGVEMGRPSYLSGTVIAVGGTAVECRIAGQVTPVASGSIASP